MKFPARREDIERAGYVFVFSRPCKRCEAVLVFYRTPAKNIAPLEYVTVGREWLMDSHFKTCPYRDEFKKATPHPPEVQRKLFEEDV